ncbi:Protein chain release factor B, partial [hydrothermal vent metagenome]
MDEKQKDLRRKMHKLGIFEKDIKEKFIHASGPGGQNVNKVATCVTLVHVPSGTQVKCQKARTQQL